MSSRSHPSSRIIPIAVAGSTNAGGSPRHFTSPPPLSLYIHVPWCVKKCPYCDFNSHEARPENDEAAYVAALIADTESALPSGMGRKVSSIFIGGGTPACSPARPCTNC